MSDILVFCEIAGGKVKSTARELLGKAKELADGDDVTAVLLGSDLDGLESGLGDWGADKVIKVWNFLTGDQSRTITGFQKEITSIRFIAETLNVVASCGDKNVHLKRADNGGNIRALSGGTDYMFSVAVSADGKVFVGGGQDSVLRIWSDGGQALATFAAPQPEQTAATETK